MVMAYIYVLVGEYDAALEQAEFLLSVPAWISAAYLRVDPIWAPMQDHPRFQALLERYGE